MNSWHFMRRICVLFLGNNSELCKELIALLRSLCSCELIVTVGTSAEALELGEAIQPDIVFWDSPQPHSSDLQSISRLRTLLPRTGIIVISLYDTVQYEDAILSAGANFFIPKTAPRYQLVDAIRSYCPTHGNRKRVTRPPST